ncbi:MAG: ATP-binding protein, partial [Thermoleophilaceae bacterium]
MRPYHPRVIDDELDEFLPHVSAIALEGPKAVGKTATAERRVTRVVHLDDPAERAIAAADPGLAVRVDVPVLFDEWQYVPPVWNAVRRAVDAGAPAGRYLLAGSAIPPEDADIHSGAGRILSLRLRPFALAERDLGAPTVSLRVLLSGARAPVEGASALDLDAYVQEIVASGFPGLRTQPERVRSAALESYLTRVVDRDFLDQGHRVRRPDALRRWMAAYAAATGATTTLEKIRDAATSGEGETPAKTTTIMYRDVLKRLYLIDPVEGWLPTRNPLRKLTEAPKHHLADPALAARLLGLTATALLRGEGPRGAHLRHGTFLGQLFES